MLNRLGRLEDERQHIFNLQFATLTLSQHLSIGSGDGVESIMSRSGVETKLSLILWMCGCLAVFQTDVQAFTNSAAVTKSELSASVSNYEPPKVLTATIYQRDGASNQPLFKFKRTATRSGSTLRVVSEYSYPNGKVAAREQVVYQNNLLSTYHLYELQTGAEGRATIERGSSSGDRDRIVFQYASDASKLEVSAVRSEALVSDTLVNDTVGPFLAAHWDKLARGEKVHCRYIVVTHRETIGFTFRKESDTRSNGIEAVVLKMEPSSFALAALIEPLHFVIEKAPPHRVLQYIGRTIPKIGEPGHWRDLDALTVFHW
jgi:hypothetical protein